MSRPSQLYKHPDYYDIAFSYRDIRKEVGFFEKVIARYSKIPVKSVLEIAAGNSPYMIELSRRGYEYVGVELSGEMVTFAKSVAASKRAKAKLVQADLREFSIRNKVDFAYILLGSLYVRSRTDLVSHLGSVARAVRPGGLYVLEGAVKFFESEIRRQSWVVKKGDIIVKTEYIPKLINKARGLYKEEINLKVKDRSGIHYIQQEDTKKIFSFGEFMDVIRREGNFTYAGSFCNFDIKEAPRRNGRNLLVLVRN